MENPAAAPAEPGRRPVRSGVTAVLRRRRPTPQHARMLEHLRKGNCEDHSLWAWCKVVELGHEAELVAGQTRHENGGGHVWVVFRAEGDQYLLEATSKCTERIVHPLAEVKDEYQPHFGVDHRLQRSSFTGALHALRRRIAPPGTAPASGPGLCEREAPSTRPHDPAIRRMAPAPSRDETPGIPAR